MGSFDTLPQSAPQVLPEGYTFSETHDHSELADLLSACITDGSAYTPAMVEKIDQHGGSRGITWHDVRVRDTNQDLVGFGRIRSDGMMSYFAVAEGHRSQGIGKAIILTRLAIAHANGITPKIAHLEPTNTLSSFYIDLGFRKLPDDSLILDNKTL